MAEILNLRRARKARNRAAAAQQAAENRAVHGRTRTERENETRATEIARRQLDGAKLAGRDDDPS